MPPSCTIKTDLTTARIYSFFRAGSCLSEYGMSICISKRWNGINVSGRLEEFHLQSPTDPYVNLSIHTAPASLAPGTSRSQADAEVDSSSQFPGWLPPPASWLIPFAPAPLQDLHHYYRMIRPRHVHRYFPPSWSSLIGFSLTITGRVVG